MKKPSEQTKGQQGEEWAAEYLKQKGLKIIEKNWKCRWGEVDLIAQTGNKIVFVEVKSRQSPEFGSGFEAVNKRKQEKILRSALSYLQKKSNNSNIHFGVIQVNLKEGKNSIEYLEFPLDGLGGYY